MLTVTIANFLFDVVTRKMLIRLTAVWNFQFEIEQRCLEDWRYRNASLPTLEIIRHDDFFSLNRSRHWSRSSWREDEKRSYRFSCKLLRRAWWIIALNNQVWTTVVQIVCRINKDTRGDRVSPIFFRDMLQRLTGTSDGTNSNNDRKPRNKYLTTAIRQNVRVSFCFFEEIK